MASKSEILDGLGLTGRDDLFLDDIVVDQGDELGRGSYAVVRKATWQGVDVAVKVLHRGDPPASAAQLIGFGDEIDKIRRLNHPNLTQFIGIAQVDDVPALVVELMSCSLLQCCVGRNRQDDVTLLGYLADTAAGLRFLHSRQIIHRDLAPKNILIRDGKAKLCDFGVAKFVGSGLAEQLRRIVGRTERPGTLLFMPPEALVSPALYDESLDIFSFGVLAFCVLSGHEPSVELLQSPRTREVVINGRAEVRGIMERERRAADISRVPDEHALKTMLVQCVANAKADRPTAAMVQERVSAAAKMARSTVVPRVSPTPMQGVDVQLQTVLRSLQQITNHQQQLLERQVAVEGGYTQIRTLLSQHAPELRHLATSQAELQRSFDDQNAAVPNQIQEIRKQVGTQVADVRAEVGEVRIDVGHVGSEVGEVCAEVGEVRTEVSGVRANVGEVLAQVQQQSHPLEQAPSTVESTGSAPASANSNPGLSCDSHPHPHPSPLSDPGEAAASSVQPANDEREGASHGQAPVTAETALSVPVPVVSANPTIKRLRKVAGRQWVNMKPSSASQGDSDPEARSNADPRGGVFSAPPSGLRRQEFGSELWQSRLSSSQKLGPDVLTRHQGVWYSGMRHKLYKSNDLTEWTLICTPEVSKIEGLASGPSGVFVYGRRTFNWSMGLLRLEGDTLEPYASSIEGLGDEHAMLVTKDHVLLVSERSMYVFDLKLKRLVSDENTFPPLPDCIASPHLVVVGDCLYAVGGRGQSQAKHTPVCRLTGSGKRSWQTVPFLPEISCDVGVACMGYCIFVAGGDSSASPIMLFPSDTPFTPPCFVFDVRDGSFCRLPEFPVACTRPLLHVIGNTLIAVGNLGRSGRLEDSHYELDIS